MKQLTYDLLKEISGKTGISINALADKFDEFPWTMSDKDIISVMRLHLYYLHCPEELTEEERQKMAENYKYQENRWKIKIS